MAEKKVIAFIQKLDLVVTFDAYPRFANDQSVPSARISQTVLQKSKKHSTDETDSNEFHLEKHIRLSSDFVKIFMFEIGF